MSKIKFDEKDFHEGGMLWQAILECEWGSVGSEQSCKEEAEKVDKAVQRLIKKYVKRERKRLARVMQPTTITEDELIEILKQGREKGMNWPSDFPGKHDKQEEA